MKERLEKLHKTLLSAIAGISIVFRKWQYILLFILFFAVFGLLMSLLNTGTSELGLLFAGIDFMDKLNIIGDAFARIFVSPTVLLISILQAAIFSMLIYVWRAPKLKICRADGTERAGIGAVLAFFGAGCPTCGISLITPVFATIFSTGAYTAVAIFGTVAMVLAFIISIITLIYLGKEVNRVVKS